MLNLIIGIFVLCSSFGITLSKITSDYGVKKNRQHIKPLTI
ncbi:MAG: hypothetical protein RL728_831, partial [Bacteroidota bacterium]